MSRRTSTRLALLIAVGVAPPTLFAACSVLNDLDSYTGGEVGPRSDVAESSPDLSESDVAPPETDSGSPIDADSAPPPGDADASPETDTREDTSEVIDTTPDSTPDSIDAMDVADASDVSEASDIVEVAPDTADATDTADTALDAVDSGDGDDGGGSSDAADASDTSDATDSGSSCHPVINEVETGSSSTGFDEFIELYNPCSMTITLNGWKLVYRAQSNLAPASGSDSSTLVTFGTLSIPSGGFLFYANASGTFAKAPYAPDGTYAPGMASAGGGVGLRDATNALIDSVFWGPVPEGGVHAFIETSPAPVAATSAPPGTSISRLPNGKDSGDNSKDFASTAPPTPGKINL